jgi:hypothetical protein
MKPNVSKFKTGSLKLKKIGLFSLSQLLLVGGFTAAHANTLYFAMPINYDQGETDTVFVYGVPGTTGTITSPNGFDQSYTVAANDVTSVVIPSTYDLVTSGAITNNGFVVSTTDPTANVGASYLSREPFTTDTTYLLNSTGLGTSYYAVGYQQTIGYPSQLSIVGTAANTTVTITPAQAFTSGQAAGVPFTITLNAGQAVLYSANTDVTGSYITSSAPVAVFGGNQCTDIPLGQTACDHTLTALPSTDNYTSTAVIPNTPGTESPSSNLVRVLAATDGTIVQYNGVTIATLNAGQYYDFRAGGGGVLTSNNPVLLNEYLTSQSEHPGVTGDPAQSWVPGVSQWLDSYVFTTPVGSQAYTDNFLDIALLTTDIGSLVLNGSAVPASDCTTIAGSLYSTCEIAIAAGAGTISDTDPFLLMIDGGTSYDSYFTYAGVTFSPGASPPPNPPPNPPPTPTPEPASYAMFIVGLLGLLTIKGRASSFVKRFTRPLALG